MCLELRITSSDATAAAAVQGVKVLFSIGHYTSIEIQRAMRGLKCS